MADKLAGKSNDGTDPSMPGNIKTIYLDTLNKQRQWLIAKNQADIHLDEEIIRKHLYQIDIEEERLKSI